MRLSRTLALSIAAEITLFLAVGFLTFLVILIVQNMAQRLGDLVAVGLRWDDAWAVIRALVPMVSAYAVPVGFLFGVLVVVGRMSADAEVTAMRACGLGLGAVLTPTLALGVGVSLLTGLLMIRVEPAARRELRAVLAEVASRGGILEPGRFRSIGPRVIYVQSRDRDNRLGRVLVADRSNPQRPFLIFAESGRFVFDREQMAIRLELERGDLHLEARERETDTHRRIAFERFDYAIDANALLDRARDLRPSDMTMTELAAHVEKASREKNPGRHPNEYRVQLQRRVALPFAPILFAAIGTPLGLRRQRSARSWGMLVCVALVGVYYTLLTFGQFLGASGRWPAALALWIPNAVFAAAAVPLLRRAQRGET